MIRLRSETRQVRNGKVFLRGREFYASEAEAADLIKMAWATVVPEPPATVLQTKVVVDDAQETVGRGGRYRRRDLRAGS